jgi:hypothetical protein
VGQPDNWIPLEFLGHIPIPLFNPLTNVPTLTFLHSLTRPTGSPMLQVQSPIMVPLSNPLLPIMVPLSNPLLPITVPLPTPLLSVTVPLPNPIRVSPPIQIFPKYSNHVPQLSACNHSGAYSKASGFHPNLHPLLIPMQYLPLTSTYSPTHLAQFLLLLIRIHLRTCSNLVQVFLLVYTNNWNMLPNINPHLLSLSQSERFSAASGGVANANLGGLWSECERARAWVSKRRRMDTNGPGRLYRIVDRRTMYLL